MPSAAGVHTMIMRLPGVDGRADKRHHLFIFMRKMPMPPRCRSTCDSTMNSNPIDRESCKPGVRDPGLIVVYASSRIEHQSRTSMRRPRRREILGTDSVLLIGVALFNR
jgi:hypothetical protein